MQCHSGVVVYPMGMLIQPATADRRAAVLADPGFGRHLTDHLV
ncbi:MAG: hypothetical protein QOD30_2374, partial [Actinomycetota bacterium]|nr:hypothetical protein [Actinomycetota bacterium]